MIVNLMMWKIMAKFKKRRNLRQLAKIILLSCATSGISSLSTPFHSKEENDNNNPNPFHSKEENDGNAKKAKESAATDKASLDQRQNSPGY